jgi:hypothetical protein
VLLSLLPIDDGDVMMRITYFRLLSSKKVKWFFARFLCEFFLSDEEEKCIKYEHSILKYPREATPIPGPHLGRSELFNRSISATTTASSLASSFLSFFFFFFCVFLAVFAVVSERKKFFSFVKFFFSLTFPRKRAAKREEFSVTFHKTTKTNSNAQISSHRLIFTLVIID